MVQRQIEVGCAVAAEVVGASPELHRMDQTRAFLEVNFDLAWKLHNTQGMQKIRSELARVSSDPNRTGGDQPVLAELRFAEAFLDSIIADLPLEKLQELNRNTVAWTSGYPPMESDFSDTERAEVASYSGSDLVSLYREYMPGTSVDTNA